MTDPDLISALSAATFLPAAELRAATAEPERIAEAVLAVLNRAGGSVELEEPEANLLFWGVHVLAGARDTRVYRPLLRLLREDGEILDILLGESLSTTLGKILVSVFDGDLGPLGSLLVDSTTDSDVRFEAFSALIYLTQTGRIPRQETHDLLVRFDDKRAAVEGDFGWVGWEDAIAFLGFGDLRPRVLAAHRDGRLTEDFSDYAAFAATLRKAEAKPDDMSRFDPVRFGELGDPVAELAWTGETAGQPVRNPMKHVGRNDPCPCGSGKKFKKCCLDAVSA